MIGRTVLILLVALLCASCAGPRPAEKAAPPAGEETAESRQIKRVTVAWEFNCRNEGDTVFTNAVLVIRGSKVRKHSIGSFLGGVARTIPGEDAGGLKIPGTVISGFLTYQAGAGHEVYVSFLEEDRSLQVWGRRVEEGAAPSRFALLIRIPLDEKGTVTGPLQQ